MLYIMAGVDGAGKSTCFDILRRYLGNKAVFVKESYTPSIEERLARVEKIAKLAASDRVVIYDRATVLDDLVYEPILQGKESVLRKDSEVSDKVRQILSEAKVLYFICKDVVAEERLKERGDEYVKVTDIAKIKCAYGDVFLELGLQPYIFDTTFTNPTAIAAQVLQVVYRKPFRIAHIVPQGSLDKIRNNGYQMCLANIVNVDSAYAEFYSTVAAEETYLLMDNGAAEGQQLDMEQLTCCYERVLPDTLCDCTDTLRKSSEAIMYLNNKYGTNKPFRYMMGVPQGKTLIEWFRCMQEMIQWPEIHSLGVSKFLQMEVQDEMTRYVAVQMIESMIKKYNRYDIEVHLLGCSESPKTIAKIAKDFPFVRGCDSAYGYICTQAGVRIYEDTKRPAGEIDFINGRDYNELLDNLSALELAAGVLDNSYDERWEG